MKVESVGLSFDADHKSTMCGSCEVFPNDSFDRRLPQKEKTDETKKTLRRLNVRVLRIETTYAWVLPARLRDQKERKWWKPSEFCSLQQTRTRDRLSPTQPGINNPLGESTSRRNLLSRQPCPRIAEPGWEAGHLDRLWVVSCKIMQSVTRSLRTPIT